MGLLRKGNRLRHFTGVDEMLLNADYEVVEDAQLWTSPDATFDGSEHFIKEGRDIQVCDVRYIDVEVD